MQHRLRQIRRNRNVERRRRSGFEDFPGGYRVNKSRKHRLVRRNVVSRDVGDVFRFRGSGIGDVGKAREGRPVFHARRDLEGTAILPKGVYVFRARPGICRNVRDSECGGDGFVEFVLVGGYGRSGLDLGSGLRLGIESVVFPAVHREIPLDKGHVAEPFEIVSVGKVIRISDESHGRKHRDYTDDDNQFGQRESGNTSKGSPHVRIIVSHRDFPSKTVFQRMYRFFALGQPFKLFTNRGLLVSGFIYDAVFPAAEVIDRFANFLAILIPRASDILRPSLRKNSFETFRIRHRTSSPVIGEVRPTSVQNEFFSVFRPVSALSRNPLANLDAGIGNGRNHYGGKDRRGHG